MVDRSSDSGGSVQGVVVADGDSPRGPSSKQATPWMSTSSMKDIAFNLRYHADNLSKLHPVKNPTSATSSDSSFADDENRRRELEEQAGSKSGAPEPTLPLGASLKQTSQPKAPALLRSRLLSRKPILVDAPELEGQQEDDDDGERSSGSEGKAISIAGSSDVGSDIGVLEFSSFDSGKWYQDVMGLIGKLQTKDEWEMMTALRKAFQIGSFQRSADMDWLKGMEAKLNNEEEVMDEAFDSLDKRLEALQMNVISSLSNFSTSLSNANQNVNDYREKRRKERRRFSFKGMKKYSAKKRKQDDDTVQVQVQSSKPEKTETKASELLRVISGQQTSIADLQAAIHMGLKKVAMFRAARAHVELSLSEEGSTQEPSEEIKEVIQKILTKLMTGKEKGRTSGGLASAGQGGDLAGDLASAREQIEKEDQENEEDAAAEEDKDGGQKLQAEVDHLKKKAKELDDGMMSAGLKPRHKGSFMQGEKGGARRKVSMAAVSRNVMMAQMFNKSDALADQSYVEERRFSHKASFGPTMAPAEKDNTSMVMQRLGHLEKLVPKMKSQLQEMEEERDLFFESVAMADQLPPLDLGEEIEKETMKVREEAMESVKSIQHETEKFNIGRRGSVTDRQEGRRGSIGRRSSGASSGKGLTADSASASASASASGKAPSASAAASGKSPDSVPAVASTADTSHVAVDAKPKLQKMQSRRALMEKEAQMQQQQTDWTRLANQLNQTMGVPAPDTLKKGEELLVEKMKELEEIQGKLRKLKAKQKEGQTAAASKPKPQQKVTIMLDKKAEKAAKEAEAAETAGTPRVRRSTGLGAEGLGMHGSDRSSLVDGHGKKGKFTSSANPFTLEGPPGMMHKLLDIQGDNIELTDQIKHHEELIRMVRTKKQLSEEDMNKIRVLLAGDDSAHAELKKEVLQGRKSIRIMQRNLRTKRQEWQSMDALMHLAAKSSNRNVTANLRATQAAMVRTSVAPGNAVLGDASGHLYQNGRRESAGGLKMHGDMMALRAVAMWIGQRRQSQTRRMSQVAEAQALAKESIRRNSQGHYTSARAGMGGTGVTGAGLVRGSAASPHKAYSQVRASLSQMSAQLNVTGAGAVRSSELGLRGSSLIKHTTSANVMTTVDLGLEAIQGKRLSARSSMPLSVKVVNARSSQGEESSSPQRHEEHLHQERGRELERRGSQRRSTLLENPLHATRGLPGTQRPSVMQPMPVDVGSLTGTRLHLLGQDVRRSISKEQLEGLVPKRKTRLVEPTAKFAVKERKRKGGRSIMQLASDSPDDED